MSNRIGRAIIKPPVLFRKPTDPSPSPHKRPGRKAKLARQERAKQRLERSGK